ncbi:MAG: branched-chain amino acid ABC transporter permease [Rhodoferax sp.]|nr:branched-chain amino acid ABC transporter permease [Rhodoferax sp.]MBP9930663.1 branched-chain amino acid ABC transporter permease [Rhodoferax sp.]HQX59533.1 branched-chain amino acid ABC transporter permease [Burkholderiaceae bacterium]HRA61739.1 branched-chain amino acid ABC transporter permease [Burkholderiaceae bacterium]
MDLTIIASAAINGLLLGGIYTLVACGLTLIYGVLHIINFAHGSLLMLAMFGVYYLLTLLGIDPYLSMFIMVPAMFVLGYLLYKGLIGRLSSGKDENILLVTLGLSILIENLALMFFKGDSRTILVSYSDRMIEMGPTLVPLPKLISFVVAMVLCALLGLFMQRTDTGRAIRAVAKERIGARLVGIDVDHIFAISYGIGLATLGAAASLMMPIFYVSPTVGHVFVLVAFTVVVLGGMGSFLGAVVGGLIIGLTESFGGLYLGESLGQIGISVIFILILLLRPSGLFGAKQ